MTPAMVGNRIKSASAFERKLKRIAQRAEQIKPRDRKLTLFERSNSYLKRETYQLVRRRIRGDKLKEIAEAAATANCAPLKTQHSLEENPFLWALRIMSRHTALLTPTSQRLFAHQLLYAYRHNVPARFLPGFLAQSGRPDDIYKKVERRHEEPSFRAPPNNVVATKSVRGPGKGNTRS